jgi:hypothetical protein
MKEDAELSIGDKVKCLLAIDALDFQKIPSHSGLEIGYLAVRFDLCVNIVCSFIVRTVRKSLHGSTCIYKAARFLVERTNAQKVGLTSPIVLMFSLVSEAFELTLTLRLL